MTDDPKSLGALLFDLPAVKRAKKVNTLSRVHRRLIEPIELTEQDNEPQLAFQHTVFCQTGLPYRNPGDSLRLWQRAQGAAFLEVQAGRVFDPSIRTTVEVGLPEERLAAHHGERRLDARMGRIVWHHDLLGISAAHDCQLGLGHRLLLSTRGDNRRQA
jgi:hypothetical protein